jgi:alpha-L-fucosidase
MNITPIMIKTTKLISFVCLLASTLNIQAAEETSQQRDQRMEWWREAKFGLFIHWGVYAVPAGTYKDEKVGGIGEWIMLNGAIPVAEYRDFAGQFNPVKYDPTAWAELAAEAGMRYIVITSKHHDGFALFPSDVTDWDVADATPYGKDLIGPLAKAARAEGLKFGLYYSQAQDWTHPGGAKWRDEEGDGWDEAHKGSFDDYLFTVALPQTQEILTRYQPDVLWWDTPRWMTPARAEPFAKLLAQQPRIIINDRLGGGYEGDTITPENHIPATGILGHDWETCMTMNRTWGFKSYDHDWKSAETLIRNLVDIVSKGGNYLLNVGPTAVGEIPAPSVELLKAIGAWMKVNGDAIYGTSASPTRRPTFGRITQKLIEGDATLYLHVFDWPKDGNITVRVENEVQSAFLLADPSRTFQVTKEEKGLVVQLTGEAPNPEASVVVLQLKGAAQASPLEELRQQADGSLLLPVDRAEIQQHGGVTAKLNYQNDAIGYWTHTEVGIEWSFVIDQPGIFEVTAETASIKDSVVRVSLAGKTKEVPVASSGDYGVYQPLKVGRFTLSKTGTYTILFKPQRKAWNPINLRPVTLKLVKE